MTIACTFSLRDSLAVLLCILPLLGIAAVPSDVLFEHRLLAQGLLVLSLLPAISLACLVVCHLAYSSVLSGHSTDELRFMFLFGVLTLGVCSLPIALVTADGRAQREKQKQDEAQVTP